MNYMFSINHITSFNYVNKASFKGKKLVEAPDPSVGASGSAYLEEISPLEHVNEAVYMIADPLIRVGSSLYFGAQPLLSLLFSAVFYMWDLSSLPLSVVFAFFAGACVPIPGLSVLWQLIKRENFLAFRATLFTLLPKIILLLSTCFHLTFSVSANRRIAISIIAAWDTPSFFASSLIRRFASGVKRMLVDCLSITQLYHTMRYCQNL